MDKFKTFKQNLFNMYSLFRSDQMYCTSTVNGITGLRCIVAVWNREPVGDFPLNVLWLYVDPTQPKHLKLYKRTSMNPSANYNNTWTEIFDYDSIWEMQEYLEPMAPIQFELATVPSLGLSILSYPMEDPHVVTTDDIRLYDKRVPTEHDHPEIPAAVLATNNSFVEYDGSSGSSVVLSCNTTETYGYSKVRFSKVEGKPNG